MASNDIESLYLKLFAIKIRIVRKKFLPFHTFCNLNIKYLYLNKNKIKKNKKYSKNKKVSKKY